MQMYFDFSAILTFATLGTGLVWAADACLCRRKRLAAQAVVMDDAPSKAAPKSEPKLVEYCRSFFPILLIVLLLRAFIVEPFRIPSGSMKPTLLEGDFILVNKYTYGLRLPVFGTKFLPINTPERGDVLIFRYPEDTSVNFIKRVVALPGDTISYKDKKLRINGSIVELDYLETEQDFDPLGRLESLKKYREHLGNKQHMVYYSAYDRLTQHEITVPEGHYFVMGDNRDNSEDSRKWGFVPEPLILGKGAFIWFSWDHEAKDVRWSRMFSKIP